MKIGAKHLDVLVDEKGKVHRNVLVGGIEVSNIKEIVINHIVHTKQTDGSWIQKGKRHNVPIAHDLMVHKVHNITKNTSRFNTWVSGYSLNIVDKRLGPHESLQETPTVKSYTGYGSKSN